MKNYFICVFFCLLYLSSTAQYKQAKQLTIGDKIPASIWRNLAGPKPAKLVILDYWSTGCLNCMEAFPKMEKLQKQFAGQLEVILINPWESDKVINERLAKLNENRSNNDIELFSLPAGLRKINGDTIYKQLFPTVFIPQHVWANTTGSVLHITGGYNAAPQNVEAVLRGEKVNMTLKDDIAAESLMRNGALRPTVPQTPPIYYSAVLPYFGGEAFFTEDDSTQTVLHMYNAGVLELYNSAFTDPINKGRIVLEMKNKEQYQSPDYHNEGHLFDEWSRKYRFSYELRAPLSSKENAKEKMRQDINYFFGNKFGIKGGTEKRKLKTLVLVQTKPGLLKTSGSEPEQKWEKNQRTWINQSFKFIAGSLHELENPAINRFYLNETGIDPELKVDMKFTGDFKDLENMRKQLAQYGLDVIEAERELDVLVIRDKD